MPKYRLKDARANGGDYKGFFDAIEPYRISKDPCIIDIDTDKADEIAQLCKKYGVESNWICVP